MKSVISIAIKDLKILFRDKAGLFFVVGFPILMGLFFGMMYGGGGGGSRGSIPIAVVDQDDSEQSRKFIESLTANKSLAIEKMALEPARESVRKGSRVGLLVIPKTFGETAGLPWQKGEPIELCMDDSRQAEAGMVQGYIMEASGKLMSERFANLEEMQSMIDRSVKNLDGNTEMSPMNRGLMKTMFGSLNTLMGNIDNLQQQNPNSDSTQQGFQMQEIKQTSVARDIDPNDPRQKLKQVKSGKNWAISFPQAMLWGVLSCVAGFSISIVRERTQGTMVRLESAPISRLHILSGKALACFVAVLGVVTMMTLLGIAVGLRPWSIDKLIVASLCVATCFVGIMMTLSVIGKTEQAVGGIGWAINMVMAMLGGCMVPLMFMPSALQKLSFLSPIRYAILALEGAIWRRFSYAEMMPSCLVLIAIGISGVAIGTWVLKRS